MDRAIGYRALLGSVKTLGASIPDCGELSLLCFFTQNTTSPVAEHSTLENGPRVPFPTLPRKNLLCSINWGRRSH